MGSTRPSRPASGLNYHGSSCLRCQALTNTDSGFVVAGAKLTQVVANGNTADGITVVEPFTVPINPLTSISSLISANVSTSVEDSDIQNNGANGIGFDEPVPPTVAPELQGNVAVVGTFVSGNHGTGIFLVNTVNTFFIMDNVVTHNGSAGAGTAGIDVYDVDALGLVSESTGIVVGNIALNNASYDLYESDPSCTGDIWEGNTFGTGNYSCID